MVYLSQMNPIISSCVAHVCTSPIIQIVSLTHATHCSTPQHTATNYINHCNTLKPLNPIIQIVSHSSPKSSIIGCTSVAKKPRNPWLICCKRNPIMSASFVAKQPCVLWLLCHKKDLFVATIAYLSLKSPMIRDSSDATEPTCLI